MAFAIRNLSVLAYANGFTLWHYKSTKDKIEDISRVEDPYFNDAGDMLSSGDIIMTVGSDGGKMFLVSVGEANQVNLVGLS